VGERGVTESQQTYNKTMWMNARKE